MMGGDTGTPRGRGRGGRGRGRGRSFNNGGGYGQGGKKLYILMIGMDLGVKSEYLMLLLFQVALELMVMEMVPTLATVSIFLFL